MLFRYSMLLALALGPAEARAVLYPSKAAALDQNSNFAGCPAIGSGSSSTPSSLCKPLLKAAAYCAYYTTPSTLGNVSEVKAAYKACVDFYQSAIDGLQLVCDYEGDSSAVLAGGTSAATSVNGASSALGAAASTLSCGRKVYFYYSDALNDQSQKVDANGRQLKKLLAAVASKSGDVVKSEVHCEQNGTPGYPPGYIMGGLAAAGLGDEKKTRTNVQRVMATFGKMINDNIQQAKLYSGRISERQSGLSTITGEDGEKAVVADGNAPGKAGKGGEAEVSPAAKMPGKSIRKIATGTARHGSGELAMHALIEENTVDFGEFIRRAERQLIHEAAADNVGGLVVSLSIHALTDGTVKTADAVKELAVFGVGIFGGVVGAPALGVALASEIVAFAVEKIAEHWNDYDKEVVRAFQKFAQEHVAQLPQATSEQIAQAYAAQKKQLAYCSKCNLPETNYGCPGYLGSQHGYNPNFRSTTPPTTAQPFSNPWLVKGYQQFRMHGGATQFSGIPQVSPTSTAP